MAILMDGKAVATKIQAKIADRVKEHKKAFGRVPGIAVILVGEDPASATYVSSKEKLAVEAGFYSKVYRLEANTTESHLLELIDELNGDTKIHGILVQLPLPKHIDTMNVIMAIDPKKDVDGFHPVNIGLLNIGVKGFIPCTPYGVIKLLEEYEIDLVGKHAVVIGRSNIVGKPMATLLLRKNATVTTCHSNTKDLQAICKQADIVIAAIGKPKMITADFIKPGAVVIDVGMNRVDGKLCGDVDFDSVEKVASHITPVPKGVGPMTITMLMYNTLQASLNRLY
ncbi:MAG: bifunctional methylenetetrahydrofolate dehydrogenase/methenyltetrahydrofolate cyclohydrolase FolD [Deferribacteraceae bacterium]|jgi:methylenetetrahydrofolate dehydrogenase (NADP+)/methenyltetrahydrofolate cyclohydrolase|nr:bifunctional methylenetetrahydrofolate dehydrogenase/methenyltetrahydrofolate cyclohydrolase FolD [Deferribacteraceae bacterium]